MKIDYLLNQIRSYKNILSNTFYLTIINVVKLSAPFIALPYVIRVIGAEKFGEIVFAQSIAAFSFIIINFGLDISAVKDVSQNRNDQTELSRIVSSVLGLRVLLFLATAFFYILMICLVPMFRANFLLYIVVFLGALPEMIFPQWYFQGVERMKYLTITSFSSVGFYLCTLFLFVQNANDYLYVPMLQIGGSVIAALIGLYLLLRVEKVKLIFPTRAEVKRVFNESVPFFASRVSVVINQNIAKIVSGVYLGMSDVAAFELAQKITTVALVPFNMFNQAVYPHNAKEKNSAFAKKLFYLCVLLAVVACVAIYILAPWGVKFFAGNDAMVSQSVSTLRLLLGFLFFGSIGMYIGSPTLVAWGYPKPFNKSVYISTITLLLIYGILYVGNLMKLEYFALSLMVEEMVILGYRYYFCKKYNIL